jgi:hypothetical protein
LFFIWLINIKMLSKTKGICHNYKEVIMNFMINRWGSLNHSKHMDTRSSMDEFAQESKYNRLLAYCDFRSIHIDSFTQWPIASANYFWANVFSCFPFKLLFPMLLLFRRIIKLFSTYFALMLTLFSFFSVIFSSLLSNFCFF